MTRNEALEIARNNYNARSGVDFEYLFRNGPKPVDADYGYRHGWYIVDDFAFNMDDICGYSSNSCEVQKAFAYL